MKKISSVNLDKLINDFSQIEKVCKYIKQLQYIVKSGTDFGQWKELGRKKNVPPKNEQDKDNGNVLC